MKKKALLKSALVISALIMASLSLTVVYMDDEEYCSDAAVGDSFGVLTSDGVTIRYVVTSSNTVKVGNDSWKGAFYYSSDRGWTGSVTIPATVSYGGVTYNVTEISGSAFQSTSIASLIIGSSGSNVNLNNIGSSFYGCSLKSLTIYGSVNTISGNAFQSCTNLSSIDITGSVGIIGGGAFSGCTSLSTLTVGGSITTISGNAFQNSSLSSVMITGSVNTISSEAFGGLTSLKTFYVGGNVTTIGNTAFRGCTGLQSFTVNGTGTISSIGSSAFQSCTSLSTFYVAGSIGDIYSNAFQSTSTPFTFTVLGNITTIDSSAFYSSSIQYFTVEGTVTTIQNNAFQSCTSLVSVNMGSIGSIGIWAFGGSTLTYITLSNTTNVASDSFQSSQLTEVYITGAGTSSSSSLISKYFSSSTWSIGNKTVNTLILDDVSNISSVGNGGTVVYYDKSNNSCSTYTYVNGSWVVSSATTTVVIVFEPQSDSVSVSSTIISSGSTVTFPAVYKVGYELIGWFSLPSGGVQYTESTVFTTNTVIYAHWRSTTTIYYDVTYDVNGGSVAAPTQEAVAEGSTFTVASYSGTKAGYIFSGWSNGTSIYLVGSTYTMGTSDVILVAVWTVVTYTVTYDVNGGSEAAPIQSAVSEGSTFTVASYSGIKVGYTLIGWNDGTNTYSVNSTYTMGTSNVILTAVWFDELKFVIPVCTTVDEAYEADNYVVNISTGVSDMYISYSNTYGANIDVAYSDGVISLTINDHSVSGSLPVYIVLSNSDGTIIVDYYIQINVLSDSYFIVPELIN
ncbi:MAG: leucine-rich repeat protein [Candidatus Methanogranum gryphiswaldense]|nr:MAG: leucine-rich repeat protein [Candidatus Methanogranum sp. U3.2.1]